MKTTQIRVRDSGRKGWKKVQAEVFDTFGVWAVTRNYVGVFGCFDTTRFNVTHRPSGWATLVYGVDRRTAQNVAHQLSEMPNQAAWRRLKNPRYITKAMREAGKQITQQVYR